MKLRVFFQTIICITLLFTLIQTFVEAKTQSGQFRVSTNVVDHCAVSISDIHIPSYDPSNTEPQKSGISKATITCSPGVKPTLQFNVEKYELKSSHGDTLNYKLLHIGSMKTYEIKPGWKVTYPASVNGQPQSIDLQVEIPIGQYVPTASYSQIIPVTLSY